MYKNSEGYSDPTAGKALGNIIYRDKRSVLFKRKKKYRPKVYICSPFAGKRAENIKKAQTYCAFAVEQGDIPYAAHLFFPQFMSDDDPVQRELGLFMGLVYLDGCRECWVFGDTISAGMAVEIERAKKRRLILRYFTEQCEEVPI